MAESHTSLGCKLQCNLHCKLQCELQCKPYTIPIGDNALCVTHVSNKYLFNKHCLGVFRAPPIMQRCGLPLKLLWLAHLDQLHKRPSTGFPGTWNCLFFCSIFLLSAWCFVPPSSHLLRIDTYVVYYKHLSYIIRL